MLFFNLAIACVCLLLQLVAGKSLEFMYGYQEIDDPVSIPETSVEEVKSLQFHKLADNDIEGMCKYFTVALHQNDPESYENCLKLFAERSRNVVIVKREVDALEGSGDPDEPVISTTSEKNEVPADVPKDEVLDGVSKKEEVLDGVPKDEVLVDVPKGEVLDGVSKKEEILDGVPKDEVLAGSVPTKKEEKVDEKPDSVRKEDVILNSAPKEDTNSSETKGEIDLQNQLKLREPEVAPTTTDDFPTGNPGSFHGGFDNILKNNPKLQNNSLEDMKSPPGILNGAQSNNQMNSEEEEAKTGESKENPNAASPNSMLLIVIGAIGVIGALAFVYNYVRSKKESKEIDDSIKLETEGKELKEMKPLMKGPMAQNGSKSMEYIDADPQIQVQTETRIEVN